MEKVENVVKLPNTPMTRNACISRPGDQVNASTSIKAPRRKDPKTFTLKVASGEKSVTQRPTPLITK